MIITRNLEFQMGSKEEKLPYAASNFPYIASQAELDYYREPFVPWHWHKAIELFFIESGQLTYCTPNKTMIFPAGSAGMVNSNVLHMTKFQAGKEKNIQLLHIFDPQLIGGSCGSLMEEKYVMPITTASWLEIIGLYPDNPIQAGIIDLIHQTFQLSEDEFGYEINIREALSHIWIQLLKLLSPNLQETTQLANGLTDKIKLMMIYIHEHFSEKISIGQLAASAFLSERECYRIFQTCLHMTPVEYMKSFRLQMACQMLADGQKPITEIGYACGFGNASYFGKNFRRFTGYTPMEYRRKWQNRNKT